MSRATTSAYCCHQNLYFYTGDTFSTSASKVTEESKLQKGAGNVQQAPSLGGMDGGKAGRCIQTPPNPRSHPHEQLLAQLTIERVPWDQRGRDEEGAQLLDQLRVGQAAPPLQDVPVQRGDALGHEEPPIGCITREKGALKVHGLRASPCADILHGCWGGTAITASTPKHPRTRNSPSSQNNSKTSPVGRQRSPGNKHLLPQEAGAARLSAGHSAFCRRVERLPGICAKLGASLSRFPSTLPGETLPA